MEDISNSSIMPLLILGGIIQMNEFIKAQLDNIELSAQKIALEARNVSLRITAILGFCAGQESGVDYLLRTQPTLIECNSNGVQKEISKSTEEIIQEIKEMLVELTIKGSVRERANGLLEFRNTIFGSVYGRTKEDFERQLKEKLKELKKRPNKGKDKKLPVPLLSEFYRKEYLPYKISDGIAESTIDSYEKHIRFIVKQKFDKPLNLYKSKDIASFLYSFPQTRKRQIMQGFLNNMFNRAITVAHIKSNPCNSVEKVKHKQKQGSAFSFIEQQEFLQLLLANQQLSYMEKCYLLFVLLTGARREEPLMLTVDDVDFDNKVLHIPGTKTEGSDRDIPLTPLVELLLKSLQVDSGKYFNMKGAVADKRFREVWTKQKGHKLHDLRHTFGTIQICVEKIDIKTVSLWLGHSGVEMTLRTYTHPEQLDKGTFLRGDLSEQAKIDIYRAKYVNILSIIESLLSSHTQLLPKKLQ